MSDKGPYYALSVKRRLDFFEKELGPEFFDGKSVIDVGANQGDFGRQFAKWGATVVCLEHRERRVRKINAHQEPGVLAVNHDMNTGFPRGHWDVCAFLRIIHHLKDPRDALIKIDMVSDCCILETSVLDSDDPNLTETRANGRKVMGTAAYYEKIMDWLGWNWTRYDDPDLNSVIEGGDDPRKNRYYDWHVKGTGKAIDGFSRLWIAEW